MDGPVVTAAQEALTEENVDIVLPYAPKESEGEIIKAFEKTLDARNQANGTAQDLVDRWFYETVVRHHRKGEGEAFTGLKPAGLDVGPVIPRAEGAIESGEIDELAAFLGETLENELQKRLDHVHEKKRQADEEVDANREYIETMLDFQVWAHQLYLSMTKEKAHGEISAAVHEHEH